MPLTTSDGERIGALCAADHEPRQWTGRDQGVLEDLAGAGDGRGRAAAREPRRRRRGRRAALRRHARHAHRLGNRRAPLDDLGQLLDDGREATFALFDLHGMRGYNDAHGHVAGDALLARLGARLESMLVGHGHVYRLGGVQLCALLDAGVAEIVAAACSGVRDRPSGVALPRRDRGSPARRERASPPCCASPIRGWQATCRQGIPPPFQAAERPSSPAVL